MSNKYGVSFPASVWQYYKQHNWFRWPKQATN